MHTFASDREEAHRGLAYFPRFKGALPEIFTSIAALSRHAYTLGYEVPEANRDGRYHRLKVEVVDQDGNPLRVKRKMVGIFPIAVSLQEL